MNQPPTTNTHIRIASATRPGQAAAAIKAGLLDHGAITVSAVGVHAINAATRAISLAGLYLYEDRYPGILAQITGERLPVGHTNMIIINWHCTLNQ